SIPVTASYPWTSAGSRTFRVVVDADDVIVETNETNNSSSRTDEPVAGLDLVVSDTDISFLNGPVYGQTLNASVTLGNSGTVSSPTFDVDVFIEGEGVSISLESIQMSLAAGESRQLDIPWVVDRQGAMQLVVRIDADQSVAELSEENNEARKAFVAAVVEGSNLKISHEEFSVTPEPMLEGMGAELKAIVRNTGNKAATNVHVHVYDGRPDDGGVLIDEVVVPYIEPATTVVASGA